jgi:hypothetical protein
LNVELQQSKPGQLELPKLRKVVRDEKEGEKKAEKAELKEVKKTVKKKKASEYELPEIPDYERPELEKYEKSDFDASDRVSCGRPKINLNSITISLYHRPTVRSLQKVQNFKELKN